MARACRASRSRRFGCRSPRTLHADQNRRRRGAQRTKWWRALGYITTPMEVAEGWGQGQGPPVGVPFEDFFSKKMAVVAPPGAVATALRHVRYQKQARSASDTRPHRAVPVDGAHRSRSLTCILTPDNDAALARCKCTVLYTYDALPPRVAGDLRGIHNRTRLRRRIDAGGPLAGPPSRPGAQTVPPCCSAEASAEQFLWYNGGFVNFAR